MTSYWHIHLRQLSGPSPLSPSTSLKQCGLTVASEKIQALPPYTSLGAIISPTTVSPGAPKIQPPELLTVSSLQSSPGLMNWLHPFLTLPVTLER